MPIRKIPPAPAHLGRRGRRLWRTVAEAFEGLTERELVFLAEAARVADRLEELRELVANEGTTVEGSRGQPVLHPAIAEERQQRDLLARLLRAISLEEDGDEGEAAAARLGQRGAAARWYGARPKRG